MRVREALVQISGQLATSGTLDSTIEAEALLRHVLGMSRAELYANLECGLAPGEESYALQLLERRLGGEPLAYILGHREFYGLDFVVTPDVLIPRQETELLVDLALEFCSADRFGEGVDIVDVGTGSGAIAIAIAHNLSQARLYATDLSADALAVAEVNRQRHQLTERVHLVHGDLLEPMSFPVDIIVSNPPYIRSREIAGLAREVRREPAGALDGGADGLDVIVRLLRQAPGYLRPGGCMLVEIAPEQLDPVATLVRQVMPAAHVSFARDLLGLPRVIGIERWRGLDPGEPGQDASSSGVVDKTGGRIQTRHEVCGGKRTVEV